MYIGNNQQVAAHLNEKGTTTGGQTGDQTGKEISVSAYSNSSSNPWTSVLRYTAESETTPSQPSTKAGEWLQGSDGKWWYRHTDGTYTKSDWELINGSWYYFDTDGWMMTGWVQVKGKWYYLQPNGAMAVNAWIDKLYYVGSDGAMLTNKMTPDGYIVNADGKWDGRDVWVKRLQTALKDAAIIKTTRQSSNISVRRLPGSGLYYILFVRRTQSGHRTGEGCFGHIIFLHALLLAKLFLGSCFRFFRTFPVDVFRAFCGVYQNGQTVIDHLCKAPAYDRLMPVSFLITEPKITFHDGNDTVCMMGQYGTFPIITRESHCFYPSLVKYMVTGKNSHIKSTHAGTSLS